MNDVYLSLGSNIDAEKNLTAAIKALKEKYGSLRISTIYESEAIGFDGANFLNCVLCLHYEESIEVLIKELKKMEDELGRVRSGPKFSSRTIDMDIILFGDFKGEFSGVKIPRNEISENAYVLLPLMELAPDLIDPVSGKTMQALWQNASSAMKQQKLWPAQFQL